MTPFDSIDVLCLAAFGRSVSHTRPGTVPVTTPITAIVSPGNMLENLPPGAGTYAVLFLRVADLPSAPAEGDTVAIDSATYTVFRVELDAVGGAHLALRFN